ncbi:MAG: hypothetical protein ABIN83_06075 [Sphingomicrobium sp.]
MGEPKAFASLSSGLLARKGAARPAMRPQGFGGQAGAGLEDLGWNDMGFEPPKPAALPDRDEEHDGFGEEVGPLPLRNPLSALTPIGQNSPIGSPVHDQRAELADAFNAVEAEGEEDYDDTAELYEAEVPQIPTAEVLSIPARKPMALDVPVAAPPAVVPAPRRSVKTRALPGSKAKAAFTLRLDKDRHLKLRLACAVTGRSAQQLVTDALDALLSAMPEINGMAEQAPGATKRASN